MQVVFQKLKPLVEKEKMKKMSISEYSKFDFYEMVLDDSRKKMKNADLADILEKKVYRKIYYESVINRIMKYLTLNGHLLPKVFFKNSLIIEKTYMPIGMIFRRPKICMYHTSTSEGVVLEHNKIEFIKLVGKFIWLSLKLFFKRKILIKDYRKKYKYMTSKEFWEKQFFEER
jgi:hypothetical protein